MSKNKATQTSEQVETAESQQPSVYDDLLKNGTVILEAPTCVALAELVDNIPADVHYVVGAVGRKQDGSAYTLRVDVTKK